MVNKDCSNFVRYKYGMRQTIHLNLMIMVYPTGCLKYCIVYSICILPNTYVSVI